MQHRNKRSHSSQSSASLRSSESVLETLDSNKGQLTELEKRLQEVTVILTGNHRHKENELVQDRSKQVLLLPQEQDKCLRYVKEVSKKLKRIITSYDKAFEKLQEEHLTSERNRQAEFRLRMHEFENQLKLCESQHSQDILMLNSKHLRSIQSYEATFTNLVSTLNYAYQVFDSTMHQIELRCNKFAADNEQRKSDDQKHREFYEDIMGLVGELNLKRINDSVSQDLSYADASPHQRNSNKNTIEMSSIEHVEENSSDEILVKSREIENSLKLLTKIGFFNTKNEDYVNQMFAIAKRSGSHNNLLESPIYPVLLDLLKNNLRQNEEQSSHDPSIIEEESVSLHSALSHRQDNVDSIMSRHLDVEQLDEDSLH